MREDRHLSLNGAPQRRPWWWCTLWLWLTVCHGKIHHAIKNGKPSISMGHRKTMAMLNNQRVWFVSGINWINIGLGSAADSILSIFHNPNQQNYRWTGLGWCLGWSMDNLKSPPQLGLESYRNVRLKKIKLGMWLPIFPLRTWIFRTVTDKLLIPSDCQVANLKRTHNVGICHKHLDVESSTTSFTRDHLRPLQREETTPDFHNSSSSLGSRNHVELSRCHQEQRQTWFPKRGIFLAAPWWRHLSFLLLYFSENPNFSDPFPSKYVPVASLWVSDSLILGSHTQDIHSWDFLNGPGVSYPPTFAPPLNHAPRHPWQWSEPEPQRLVGS